MDIDLHILHDLMAVSSSSKLHTVSTVLFRAYLVAIVEVTNFLFRFSMIFLTKANTKLDNVKIVNSQVIGIISFHFTKFPIIYPVEPIYYCTGNPSNIIS